MRWAFLGILGIHGAIHFMGFAKAFGWADLSQLTQPISRGLGIVWLAAGIGILAAGALLLAAPRVWWAAGLGAALLSQVVVVSSWTDAKFATIANVVLLAGSIYGLASQGPPSLRAEYRREVRARLAQTAPAPTVTEADLARLPDPVQRYLRLAGAVGQPRVRNFRAQWRGRIRGTPDDPWMTFTAEQHNFPGEPSRFFFMDAVRSGLPVDVFHAFRKDAATMNVRLVSLLPLVRAGGEEITRAETVTLFNDLCLVAPAALIDPAITWEPIDARLARGRYTVGANSISADLVFNDAGELVNFVSDDRLVLSPDASRFTRQRWSTPVGDYRQFGPWRLSARGEGRWHPPTGEFVYIELELLDVRTNSGAAE